MKTKIPFFKEITGDLDSPLEIYLKFKNDKNSYFFESVEGGDKWARYSLIGLKANRVIKVLKNQIEIYQDGGLVDSFYAQNPLDYIDELQKSYSLEEDPNLPKFNGGLVGYFAYDCVRFIEKKLSDTTPPDTLGTPDALFMVSEEVAVFDNLKNKLHLIILVNSKEETDAAEQRLDELEDKLRQPLDYQDFKQPERSISESDFVSGFGE